MTIGLVTCFDNAELIEGDRDLIPLLAARGHQAEAVIWNDVEVVWTKFDALIIRSTWDYYYHIEAFKRWLSMVLELKIRLCNSPEVIYHNLNKFYLRDFQAQGFPIIPTVFVPQTESLDLSFLADSPWEKVIIKPAISAGAYLTELFAAQDWQKVENGYREIAQKRDLLVQRFIPEVLTRGEVSMLFFEGVFSHAIVKVPKAGDFRVQSEFGGHYSRHEPTAAAVDLGYRMLASLEHLPTYARLDGIETPDGFLVMELEMIEPDLYLEFSPTARERFLSVCLANLG